MHLDCEVAERIELEEGIFSEDAVREGLRIEEILHRAHQIHRARGGLIGYDLEDWLQAERDSIGEIDQPFPIPETQSSGARTLEILTLHFKRRESGGSS